jgi:8-oxo-dGTP pyrophosphatase MutT (NUDIX family)
MVQGDDGKRILAQRVSMCAVLAAHNRSSDFKPVDLEPTQFARVLRFYSEIPVKFKQFAALPYRMRDDDLEILLITTRKKGRWSVPKGWPMKKCTPHETAATEAYEEAGVRGSVSAVQVGRFRKRRMKKKQSVQCQVQIYPLEVKHQKRDWPEKQERTRTWVSPRKAAKLVRKSGLRRAIKAFESRQ